MKKIIAAAFLYLTLLSPIYSQTCLKLENDNISIELDMSSGLCLGSVYDKAGGIEWVDAREPLFTYTVTGNLVPGGYDLKNRGTSSDLVLKGKSFCDDSMNFTLSGDSFEVLATLSLKEGDCAARMSFVVSNLSDEPVLFHLVCPAITALKSEGRTLRAAIPYEIGSVGPYGEGNCYGAAASRSKNDRLDMPGAFNALEVASVYEAGSGAGIFFADLDGVVGGTVSPLQLAISDRSICGKWSSEIIGGGFARTPELAVGITHTGNWHAAVDYYMANRVSLPDPSAGVPEWLLESGALYSLRREGTGGAYQCLPGTTGLESRISDFKDLPKLLKEAESMGTSNLLLIDFFEKAYIEDAGLTGKQYQNGLKPYWNKGDYIIRSDLGGEDALKKGIASVHRAGGRVIVYVEPFIVYKFSRLGRTKGAEWAARTVSGELDATYKNNFTMNPANKAWQDEVVRICERLVREFGIDGILLDSTGWQWNRLYYTLNEGKIYSQNEYNAGFLALSDRVRRAIREIRPDAVVLSESGPSGMIGHNDGGFTADFVWGMRTSKKVITSSPTRYAVAGASLYSAGTDINSINQVFAAGCSLALCDYWLKDAAYIRQLVRIRQKYSDALIYGKQVNIPETEDEETGLYLYEGDSNRILILLNTSKESRNVRIDTGGQSGRWKYIFGDKGTLNNSSTDPVSVMMAPESLRVLVKIR